MISRRNFLLWILFGLAALSSASGQQQPVMKVDVTRIGVLRSGGQNVIYIRLLEKGANYKSVPTVTLSAPNLAGGTQARARVYLAETGGTVEAIEVFDAGSGYTSAPTVTITGGEGEGATAEAWLGYDFDPPNEAFGPAKVPIMITAQAIGTYMVSSFTYSFYVNGISIGKTTGPVSPTSPPPVVMWNPPQPGSYFITVEADDGVSKFTSLAVRYFATGTTIASPLTHTLVPQGSSVVLQADATVGQGFIREIQFYDNGAKIGEIDGAIPYSLVYEVPGSVGSAHNITAQARTNTGELLPMSDPVVLLMVQPITPLPTCVISSPSNGATLGLPSADKPIPIIVDATSRPGGSVNKVELYVDGVLTGTKNSFPYHFEWSPTVVNTYQVVALAFDDKNNVIASTTNAITVGTNQVPTVTITSPSPGFSTSAGQSVLLIAGASDSSGITQVRFQANGMSIGAPVTTPPYSTSWTPAAGGTYTLVAEATNGLGGVAASTPVTVEIAPNFLPTVVMTSPANGGTSRVGSSSTLLAAASDPDGVIARVQFYANGTLVGTSTTPPYKATWIPAAEGLYRLTAVAVDNAGAASTSTTLLVTASSSAGEAVAAGKYQTLGEAGNFAMVSASGSKAAFLAYSTTPGVQKTYFYPDVPVGVFNSFSLVDSKGVSLLKGSITEVGVSGTFDGGRVSFSGMDTRFSPSASPVTGGYYTGSINGRAGSTIVGIVGSDGSVMLYVAQGSFTDAGGGGLAGKIDATGAFSFGSVRGNRFTGRVDQATGALSGSFTGSNGGDFTLSAVQLATGATGKVLGDAREVGSDIRIPATGRTYDQVLLTGSSASITADPGQITRISYVDLSDDIVQVEFTGAGRLALTLANPTGPAPAAKYNQPEISYMKGHAGIVITGADETTNVSVFSVGRITAANQNLFSDRTAYDGVADVAYIAVFSRNGKFGGIRSANATFVASEGIAGVCAPGVLFTGPVYVGDISAGYNASPMLLLGSAFDVRITGGDLWQANSRAVQVSGITSLRFVDGTTSHGRVLSAQLGRSRLEQQGVDVTAQISVSPTK